MRKLAQNEGEILCNICNAALTGAIVCCPVCDTPYHPDCWDYNKGCAVYGCQAAAGAGSSSARPSEAVLPQGPGPGARRQSAPLVAFGCLVGVGLGLFAAALWQPDPAARPQPAVAGGLADGTMPPGRSEVSRPAAPPDEEWMRRQERMRALEHVKDPEVLQELLSGLRTTDELLGGVHVRTAAAETLGTAGWKEACPDLLQALDREGTFFAQPTYAIALHKLGHPAGLARLQSMLEGYRPGMDRLASDANERQLRAMCAASAAAMERLTEVAPILVSYLDETDPEILRQVLGGLKQLEYKPAIPAIARLLAREDCATVWAACELLVVLGARSERSRIEARLKQCPAFVSGLPGLLRELDAPSVAEPAELSTKPAGPSAAATEPAEATTGTTAGSAARYRIKTLFTTLEVERGADGKSTIRRVSPSH
jgi:hypothetical protein